MVTLSKWPWGRSLAIVPPGGTVEVDSIRFRMVKDYCYELGIREGSVLTCLTQNGSWVELELPPGKLIQLPREYAWFVAVEEL